MARVERQRVPETSDMAVTFRQSGCPAGHKVETRPGDLRCHWGTLRRLASASSMPRRGRMFRGCSARQRGFAAVLPPG